ncbi:hypothetical protein BD410DRAFT_27070 [Rickenella mellea]|uniref:RING-type domain-containing protein n=1 Tax=Rickenella mellea TaxID=50990 RepID=A0A4R5XGK6_9AGAM|nr:hypothetical protein BD410DRAFT_27070 [Rickenella mellea]
MSTSDEFEASLEELEGLRDAMQRLAAAREPKRKLLLDSLPVLKEDDLVVFEQHDSSCPICLTPFQVLLVTEEMALAMDSPAFASHDLGVTRLADTCGHHFCRKDITTWINEAHDSCPTCRRPFFPETSDSGPTESNRDDAAMPSAPSIDELTEWLRVQHGITMPAMPNPGGSAQDRNEIRDEYVGMYS